MSKRLITSYSAMVRYDADTGVLQAVQGEAGWELAPVTQLATALTTLAALDEQAGVFGAGYALAQTAHEWRGRPTDAQRGAIIQMVQRLRSNGIGDRANLLGAALERADAALLAGDAAERSITTLLGEHLRRADRAADRCGRRATGLIDAGDQLLVYGFGGPPLLALLQALPELDPAPGLRIAGTGAGPQALVVLASNAGFGAQMIGSSDPYSPTPPDVCLITVQALGADGGAICPAGSGALILHARENGIPCYLLAPSGPAEQTAAIDLHLGQGDVVLADLISAIVTDRGIYRPAMIGRYQGDADTPLDVIPLN